MITDPVIIENSKKLEVPDFNKKEVEEIAKGVCVPRVDIFNPPQNLVEVFGIGLEVETEEEFVEYLKQNKIAFYDSDVSDETLALAKTVFKKAVNDGVVFYSRKNGSQTLKSYLFLNYAETDYDIMYSACFGCEVASADANHSFLGVHAIITINDTYVSSYVDAKI